MTTKNLQQFYTQLPQSLSDSDSEKESIHDKHEDDIQIIQHRHRAANGKNVASMSPLRKCMFIASISLCFLVVAIFLWVLPCSNDSVCRPIIGKWKNEYEGFALEGPINVVRHRSGESLNFIFKVRSKVHFDDSHDGVIALKSSNGAVAWFLPQMLAPKQVSCDLIDVNNDGIKDCFLLGFEGLLVIDPLTSEKIWYAHNKKTVIRGMDFPIVLPDLNADNVPDLLTIADSNSHHNKITLLCGKTGKILTEILVHRCESIAHFSYNTSEKLIVINCWNVTDNYFKIPLKGLQRRIYNSSVPVQASKINHFNETASEDYILNNSKLIFENKGICPNCTADIFLINLDTRKRLLDWSSNRTYIARPISYSFKTSKHIPLQFNGRLNGFILKLWQWPEKSEKMAANDKQQKTIERNLISERVLLILFSDTEVQVINVSYAEIIQLCYASGDCQPAISAHNESLILTDLDFDGFVELINYCTTYKCAQDSSDSCLLTSKVEVIKLENEMPKLFLK